MVAITQFFGLVAALAAATNAVVVNFYNDTKCMQLEGSQNIFDNTCATGVPGYQSFIITTAGTDPAQQVTAYSRDACAGPSTACIPGTNLNACTQAVNGAGGSNAISSSLTCGSA